MTAMTFIIAIFLFASVFLLFLSTFDILRKGSDEYQKRYVTKANLDLENAFIYMTPNQLFVLNIAITAMFFVAAFLMFETWTFRFVFAIVGFFVPGMLVKRYKKKRLNKFNTQLVDSLVQMSNAFKAGLSFPQAMASIAEEAPNPLKQEFDVTVRELKLGVQLEEALINMAKRVGSEDLDLTVVSTNIARQMGGNMSEMYDTISQTIRERFRLEGKIDALTSQGKMQGIVVGLLPLGLGFVLSKMRPDLMDPMMESWFGIILVLAVVLLEVLGGLIIKKIVSIDV